MVACRTFFDFSAIANFLAKIENVGHQTRQTDGWTYLEIDREKVVADLLKSMDLLKAHKSILLFETRQLPFPGVTKIYKLVTVPINGNHA